MTHLALHLCHYVNGVARRHGEVSRQMFPGFEVHAITNGVHAASWMCKSFQELFDLHLQGWRSDNFNLRNALAIPHDHIWQAHVRAKRALMDYVNHEKHANFSEDVFTLGFARRAATYKRADLLVSDPGRLKAIAAKHGPIQIVYGGKAHPRDGGGKELIRRVHAAIDALHPEVRLVYLSNYDMNLGRLIPTGVDLWVNTPMRPQEASGTSGMKAAMNGVPSISTLDGWWVEGCVENVTGWSIGAEAHINSTQEDVARDASDLYDKLERIVLPMWHNNRNMWIDVMKNAIAINGAYFNTQRMVQDYVVHAYFD